MSIQCPHLNQPSDSSTSLCKVYSNPYPKRIIGLNLLLIASQNGFFPLLLGP